MASKNNVENAKTINVPTKSIRFNFAIKPSLGMGRYKKKNIITMATAPMGKLFRNVCLLMTCKTKDIILT